MPPDSRPSSFTIRTITIGSLHRRSSGRFVRFLALCKFPSFIKTFLQVIHDPGTKEAVAFVGLNNPYATAKPSPPCTDICHKITWANWDMNNKGGPFPKSVKIPFKPVTNCSRVWLHVVLWCRGAPQQDTLHTNLTKGTILFHPGRSQIRALSLSKELFRSTQDEFLSLVGGA